MGEVLSQNEIDSLLQALSSGQKSICVRWKSFLNIMEDFFRRTYLFI